jgi:hypothetical protein
MMTEDLPFKIVRSNGHDEVLACAMNLLMARAAYRATVRMYPEDTTCPGHEGPPAHRQQYRAPAR